RLCWEDLMLEETNTVLPGDETTARVLAAAASEQLDKVLPAPDSSSGLWLTRVRCLRAWMPELALPALDAADLRASLAWLCLGRRSFAELRAAPWLDTLQSGLTHAQRQAIDCEAPERLAVPSGSHITLRYEVGRPPVLAV